MKREEILEEYSEFLVLDAPFSNGDLSEHINGVNLSVRENTSVTWNNTYGMYCFDSMSSTMSYGNPILFDGLELGIFNNSSNSSNIEYTISFDYVFLNSASNGRIFPSFCICNGNNSYRYVNSLEYADWKPSIGNMVSVDIVCGSGLVTILSDGVEAFSKPTAISGNIAITECNRKFTFSTIYGRASLHGATYCIKNLKVFNKNIFE